MSDTEWELVQKLLVMESTPCTSSVGRLFDAVASMLGLCHSVSFEGEAASMLESLAGARRASRYPVELTGDAAWTADPARIIEGVASDIVHGRDRSEIASAFHGALGDLIVLGCERMREVTGLGTVVLSGGVFMNKLLAERASETLHSRRFRVLLPKRVPCNDGGLSLGQAHVAACALQEELCA